MAYIVSKTSSKKGKERKLYYLVQSYREDGKVKRKTIAKLGESQNIDQAIENIKTVQRQTELQIQKYKLEIQAPKPVYGRMSVFLNNIHKYIEDENEKLVKLENWIKQLNSIKQEM